MDAKDWIQIFSVAALITGWFVNGYLNRRNEIAKKRMEFVLPTLKSFSKVWYKFLEQTHDLKEFSALIVEGREEFHLYGSDKEVELFNLFIENYGADKNMDLCKKSLEELRRLVRERIRKELSLKD